MKVIDHINHSKNTLISFEIVPPMRGGSIKNITNTVKELLPFNPAWIDVTAHSASANYKEKPDGSVERQIFKKRPGTIGICGIIQNRFKVDTVAHILCQGFTQEETEDALIELNFLGVENVLAIKGDGLNYKKSYDKYRNVNFYASDLVSQIHRMKEGKFLQELSTPMPLDFGLGVAAYPEKHFESPNLKSDINFLKEKIKLGAEYAVSQMFFENQKYLEYVLLCKETGIDIPIVPGLKIIKSIGQLTNIPKNFYISLPEQLVNEIQASPKHVEEIGVAWAIKQCEELLKHNVPSLHFYVMNEANLVIKVLKKLGF